MTLTLERVLRHDHSGRSPPDSRVFDMPGLEGKFYRPTFEVPLRSLISKKIKIFFAGQVASSIQVSPSLGHPSTSSQMGTAKESCAASRIHKKVTSRTIAVS